MELIKINAIVSMCSNGVVDGFNSRTARAHRV